MLSIIKYQLKTGKFLSPLTVMSVVVLVIIILSACSKTSANRPAEPFRTPVFQDKETFTYILSLHNAPKGKAVFRLTKEGQNGWKMINTGKFPGLLDSVAVSKIKPNLQPISTEAQIKNRGGLFKVRADYSQNELRIGYPGSNRLDKTIAVKSPIYDFGEFLMLLRNLNFKVGAVYNVKEAWPSFGQVFTSRISILGIENLTVPAGKFRAYHITHTFGGGSQQTVYHSWYETGRRRRLIRHDNGSVIYELKKSG